MWEQSLTWEKRCTAGPPLVQELTGAAKRLVAGRDAGWVAFRGRVTVLMDHLRKALGKPTVNEVTDLLATYFKGCKRKNHETMNEYVTRKFEAYFRASQALKRVAPHYEAEPANTAFEMPTWSRRSSTDSRGWYHSGPSEAESTGTQDRASLKKPRRRQPAPQPALRLPNGMMPRCKPGTPAGAAAIRGHGNGRPLATTGSGPLRHPLQVLHRSPVGG